MNGQSVLGIIKELEKRKISSPTGKEKWCKRTIDVMLSNETYAVQYRLEHPELPLRKAAENLGVSESALKNWMKAAKEHKGEVPTRGSGNYASEEAKEIARLQRELRDTKDALEVLKKQSVFWKTDKNSLHGYF